MSHEAGRDRWAWRQQATACVADHVASLPRGQRQPERQRLLMLVHALTDVMRKDDADGFAYGRATDAYISEFCAGTDRKAVRRGMDELEALGLVHVHRRSAHTTVYRSAISTAGAVSTDT